jgi:preprotein translocase subunit SecF
MRLIFSIVSLLVVLAIVGILGKKQLEALGLSGPTSTRAAEQGADVKAVSDAVAASLGPTGAAPVDNTVAGQSQSIQNNVRSAVNAAMQQGANRSEEQPSQ